MALGQLVVQLGLNAAEFTNGLTKAEANAKRFAKQSSTAIRDSFAGNLLADFAQQAAATFARLPGQLLKGIDALNDVKDATGASIENISALEDVAVRTGSSLDTVSGILVKFNNGLKEADGKNGVSQALKAIGLDAERLKQVDPAEALRLTAVALAGFADDGNKARATQELFGKSVREAAPFLKDLAEQGSLNAKVTTEQADEAEKFNKQLFSLQKNALDAARGIANSLIPTLNDFIEKLRQAKAESINGSLFDGIFGTNPVARLTKDAELISAEISRTTDTIVRLKTELDRKGGSDSFLEERIGRAREKLLQLQATAQVTTGKLRDLANIGAPIVSPQVAAGPKPSIGNIPTAKTGPKGKDEDADFKSYLSNLERQIQGLQELTAVEKLLDDIRRGSLTVSTKQEAELAVLAKRIDQQKDLNEQVKFRRQLAIDEGDAVQKANEEYSALIERLLQGGPVAQLQAQRDTMLQLAEAFETGRINAEQFNDAATGFLGLNNQLEKSKSLTEELGLTFTSAFEDAIVNGGKLRDVLDGILKDILRIVVRKNVTEPLGNALSSAFSGGGGGGGFFDSIGSAFSSLLGFANGGNPPVGKPYLVGERGPEIRVDRSAGTIIPNGAFGGGSNVNIVINNNAEGTRASAKETTGQGGVRQIEVLVETISSRMAGDVRAGRGPLTQALTGTFGLNRAAGAGR